MLSRPILPLLFSCALLVAAPLLAAGPDPAQLSAAAKKGIDFLKTSQADDGSWTAPTQTGLSALVVYALLEQGVPVSDPVVAKGLKYLESHVRPDGGIYVDASPARNYESCIALLALASAEKQQPGKYTKQIQGIAGYLKNLQWDEQETGNKEHASFGGAGYGRSSRPDMSNTTFFLEALKAAGVSSSDPAMQNALVFVSRCQNLVSEHNKSEFPAKVNDGGFYYTIAAGGSSMAGANEDGGLRSYGSMTYAGLKSMIYAGLTPSDPRVAAAEKWIKERYTVNDNPGMGADGLFYYYQTFGKTLKVLGWDEFTDASGTKHDWKKDLADKVISLQKENGSWVNTAPRFMEGDPNLVTAYALLALTHCQP